MKLFTNLLKFCLNFGFKYNLRRYLKAGMAAKNVEESDRKYHASHSAKALFSGIMSDHLKVDALGEAVQVEPCVRKHGIRCPWRV